MCTTCKFTKNMIAFYSKADHPQMPAFSYAWSLPVTWQRLPLHQSIRHGLKPNATRKPHGSTFYRVMADLSFTLRKWGFSTFFAAMTLILTRWPSYTNMTHINRPYSMEIYRMCKYQPFLHHGFKKLSPDRQTDTTEIIPCRFAGGQ